MSIGALRETRTLTIARWNLNPVRLPISPPGLKYIMGQNHKEVELIEQMLKLLPKQYKSVEDQLLYERGYLTGLLASIAHDDVSVRVILTQHLKELLKK